MREMFKKVKIRKLNTIELVKTREEIKHNIQVLDKYLSDKVDPEYSYALDLIKKGICFVVDDTSGRNKYYPSRFIGYVSNSMDKHQNNESKDGKITNPAISKILGSKPESNLEYEKDYREYCESLGIIPREKGAFGIERKYWKL